MAVGNANEDSAGVVMAPMLMFLIAVIASVLLELALPVAFLPAPGLMSWSSWVGAGLFVGGYWLALSGRREFIRSGTNVFPHLPALKLVTTGPYRFTRNPMYLGLVIGFAGIVLAFSLEAGILVFAVFAFTLDYGVVRREERYLAQKFGAPYADFLSRTRRWV